MRFLLMAVILSITLLPVARAQEADERYIAIHAVIEQAESLAESGDSKAALSSLTDAQSQLQRFQRIYPDWNPTIINYRLDDLAKKIAMVNAKLAAAVPPPAPARAGNADAAPKISPEEQKLRAQLQSVQTENQTLQAKLKEALSTQPAAIDSGELVKAQEQIRSLMKENDLLKTSAAADKNTNGISSLRRQLADALEHYTTEHSRGEKLVEDNAALQRELKRVAQDASTVDLLRSQNDRLKSQLAALQSAANDAAAAGEVAAKLKAANRQINTLQSKVQVVTLEKGALEDKVKLATLEKSALENKVKQLSAEIETLRTSNFEGRIRDLTEQRDELAKQLAKGGKKTSRKSGNADAQLAELNNEIETLRARLAVAESKPMPYSAEELALFRETPPQINDHGGRHSIHELPSGTAELVASAQRHFANREFDAAEADYRKILERGPNNGLVLADLATIELKENKLADAEKHINAALAESPDDAFNISTLGMVQLLQQKYDAALDSLSRASKLDPNNPEIQNSLGLALSGKGLRVQAETALRKAIQLNPQYGPAHNNLAVIYLSQTPPMPMLARWHYEKAIAAGEPRNPDLERHLADKGAPVETQ